QKTDAAINVDNKAALLTQQEKALILSRTDDQLKDIVKNYRQYDYSEDMRNAAIERLKQKGVSELELQMAGDFENKKYSEALEEYTDFVSDSKKAIVLYILSLLGVIGLITFNNWDVHFAETGKSILQISQFFILLIFYIFMIKSVMHYTRFQKIVGHVQDISSWIVFLLLGPAIYLLLHYTFKKKMKEELRTIS
ncbi:MAG: hypothetical protein R3359_10390, partial [Marinirhabdus sp.]|nr:hypothetical protein [Marinirhabdus sp.]